jgi:hypothetical protein
MLVSVNTGKLTVIRRRHSTVDSLLILFCSLSFFDPYFSFLHGCHGSLNCVSILSSHWLFPVALAYALRLLRFMRILFCSFPWHSFSSFSIHWHVGNEVCVLPIFLFNYPFFVYIPALTPILSSISFSRPTLFTLT